MTTEEKAKAYDEALEKARKRVATDPQDHTVTILKDIFPELAESEDERIRKDIIAFLQSMNSHCDPAQDWDLRNRWLPYLEKQKEQKPAEWSERDEKILASVMSHIADSQCFDHFHDISKEDIYTWLKSLRPRPHWKPSEEQMDALDEYIWRGKLNKNKAKYVISLYEDLTKLI